MPAARGRLRDLRVVLEEAVQRQLRLLGGGGAQAGPLLLELCAKSGGASLDCKANRVPMDVFSKRGAQAPSLTRLST